MLALASASAMAEWKWVAEDAAIGITVYIDPATINKAGDMAKMSSLIDFHSALGNTERKYLSQKEQGEYDCRDTKSRTLAFSRTRKNMATGEVVYSDNTPSRWVPVVPGSAGEVLWDYACGKQALPNIK